MFWLVTAGVIVLVAVPMVRVLVTRRSAVATAGARDVGVYKDQLAEVERDLARGVLAPAEAQAARTEVARRLLAADRRAQSDAGEDSAERGPAAVALGLVGVALAGSVWLYFEIGRPGMPDMPLQARVEAAQQARENRPDQLSAEASAPSLPVEIDPAHAELVQKLREALEQNPNDTTGLRLLVDNEARLGNLSAARAAQQQLMGVLGDQAKGSDFTDLSEILILAAGGYVSPEAERALVQALNADPTDPRARYYSGLSLAQTGRPDVAYRMWMSLLQESPPNAPWIPLISAQIGDVARAAGIAPPDLNAPGPDAQAVESAEQMSEEDRNAMIAGMVAGLSERLATEGGTAAEWARLIRAYGVLGETAQASAIWKEAKTTFANSPAALDLLRAAAQDAEVSQ
ncbi:c-type cytochrome biogenesis protein CcmI [Neptunicoccus cionae]|uniref:C-type cytochrome biogenesis protein CcmI n=1 Tax=Neptunicoccus cionae TaxID=2035344 RepID=A0A916QUE3_9RHOB|nr:c-type cytochrome biogenesis protein CcmI [Amylibacter cionae]GGA08311.1 c-type cytochrome biogenesis protein CcmI [Amylibacter cionae]